MLSYIHYKVIQTNRQISLDAVKKQNKKTKNVVDTICYFFYIKIYFIYLHLLAVYEFREDAIFVIQSNSVKKIILSFFLMENKERQFDQEQNFVTYASWIDISLTKILCLLKQSLIVFWDKKFLEGKPFSAKNAKMSYKS